MRSSARRSANDRQTCACSRDSRPYKIIIFIHLIGSLTLSLSSFPFREFPNIDNEREIDTSTGVNSTAENLDCIKASTQKTLPTTKMRCDFDCQRERMFSCGLLTLIASSLLSHTSIRLLAVHRSLIMLRVFSFSLPLSRCLSGAFSRRRRRSSSSSNVSSIFDYITRLITLNMRAYPASATRPPLFISVSQLHGACSAWKMCHVQHQHANMYTSSTIGDYAIIIIS